MKRLVLAYDLMIAGAAGFAALIPVYMLFGVIATVVVRYFHLPPIHWMPASIEFGMLYCTMLAAPWLVRRRGHVAIEVFVNLLPPSSRVVVIKTALLLTVLISLIFFYFSLVVFVGHLSSGEYEPRSVDVPLWLLFLPLLTFLLIAVEYTLWLFKPLPSEDVPSQSRL